jgi:hypothetical protein
LLLRISGNQRGEVTSVNMLHEQKYAADDHQQNNFGFSLLSIIF